MFPTRPLQAIMAAFMLAVMLAVSPLIVAQEASPVALPVQNASTVLDAAATPQASPEATPDSGEELTGYIVGDPAAPVTLQIYADYQCPHCKNFFLLIEPQIVENYVETGQVKLELLDMTVVGVPSLESMDDDSLESVQAAEAAMCAAEQDAFLDYRNALFTAEITPNSGDFSDDNLKAFADDLGLDTARFNDCLDSGRYEESVISFVHQAVDRGVSGTPMLSINGGEPFFVPENGFEGISEMLDEALAS